VHHARVVAPNRVGDSRLVCSLSQFSSAVVDKVERWRLGFVVRRLRWLADHLFVVPEGANSALQWQSPNFI
jgi:hypothetical protein